MRTMYLDTSTIKKGDKTYTRHLLRQSYREDGKVKHRTVANLSACSDKEIAAIRLALRHKEDLRDLLDVREPLTERQGLSFGAVWLVYSLAREMKITQSLGTGKEGKLALWQIIARVIDQGSRLSAVRLAGAHAACDVLGPGKFNEDDLYANLDWLFDNQATIEDRLFKILPPAEDPGLFLYDVTSSYLEGTENELAAFGYNRDGKRGKRQIVIGLLCNADGVPLSVEVFAGNTQDPKTFGPQIKRVAERFGAEGVTFVGDRGMIKSHQISQLNASGFHYITAITKPQIERLLETKVIQLSLFDQGLAEVKTDAGIRYVLRRNPVRAEEIRKSREDKLNVLRKALTAQNMYLSEHPRAKVTVAMGKITARCKQFKMSDWVEISVIDRTLELTIDDNTLKETAQLDGCYILKTDLSEIKASKETVLNRYKDLASVEWAFRTSKTTELELRPIHVRLATRTRGHVFVVMVAYRIVQELAKRWRHLDVTIQEGLDELATLCTVEVETKDGVKYNRVPEPRQSIKTLLDAANVHLPSVIPVTGIKVTTKKKLPTRRNI
ncbi:MAG: IS1634 family transposase [Proteobacteria bacterium]|nr:IS1634 family transposase [Pseudomonadota bacterium]